MMTAHGQNGGEKLLPVVAMVFGCYVVIMAVSYFIGSYLF